MVASVCDSARAMTCVTVCMVRLCGSECVTCLRGAFTWRRVFYMVTCVMARVTRLRSTCSEVRDDLGDGLCDGVHTTACVVTCTDKRV